MTSGAAASSVPRWLRLSLVLAGIYNLLWGAAVVLFPHVWFTWADIDPPRWPQIWQCVGMIVGVYGIGYLIASRDPDRHWPIVLVGFLGKVAGPIGLIGGVLQNEIPLRVAWINVTNDVIWWVPFALLLLHAWRAHHPAGRAP